MAVGGIGWGKLFRDYTGSPHKRVGPPGLCGLSKRSVAQEKRGLFRNFYVWSATCDVHCLHYSARSKTSAKVSLLSF
jgi:hypothetical protein